MQPSDALGIVAQVSVTLAGFAGIVVVFRPQSVHEWSPIDKFRLRLLLTNSALPLGYSLLGILLLAVDPPVPGIWRWCSALAFATQVTTFVMSGNPARKIPPEHFRSINKPVFYGIGALATVALVLQVLNFAVWNRFWAFLAIMFAHLVAAIVQFLRMVFIAPAAPD